MATAKNQDGDSQKPRWRQPETTMVKARNQAGDSQKPRWRRLETKMAMAKSQDSDSQKSDGDGQSSTWVAPSYTNILKCKRVDAFYKTTTSTSSLQ